MNRASQLLATSTLAVGLLIPLADASFKGAVVLAVALVATWALRQRSAAERHLTWVVALSLLLVLPVLAAVLPGWQVLPESWSLDWQAETTAPLAIVDSTPAEVAVEPIMPIDLSTTNFVPSMDEAIVTRHEMPLSQLVPHASTAVVQSTSPEVVPVAVAELAPQLARTVGTWDIVCVSLLATWLAGVLLLSARLVRGCWVLRRMSRRAHVVTDGPLFDEFNRCCRELGVEHPVQLLMGEATAMPMAWGIWGSRILVPSVFGEWTPSQQRAVLLHELGHVLRRDPLWHGLVQFTTALYWFHPCVWLAAWRIHVERERACDDLVLNRGVGAQDYARHLLDVVSQGRFRRIGASVGVAMASTNKLEGRVRSILDERQDRRPLTRTLQIAGLLSALVVGPPLAMMRVEGDVSVADTDVSETEDDTVSESSDEPATESDKPEVTGDMTLRGVDLSGHEFVGDWNAMHAAGGPLDREKSIPLGGYIRLQVKTDAPGEWLIYYSPLAENFYARLKVFDDETYYGPIIGDPVALMRLEEYFATSINRHREVEGLGSPRGLTELQYLLTSREPTLVLSGFHVLANLNAMEIYEERHLRKLVDEAASWMLESPDLAVEVEQVIAVMDDHQARIEELKTEIPDNEYDPGREPTEEELAANWGPKVDGLSMAFIPWESGEPTIRLGERVEALLLVRNVSEEPVRLSSIGFMEGVSCSLVDEETEEERSVTFPIFFGGSLTQRYLLQPGDVFGIKKPVFSTGPRNDGDFSAQIDVALGHTYRLSMSLELPEAFSKDGEGRIVMPASGEFYNRLTAGDVRFRVVEVDGNVSAESDDADMQDDAPVEPVDTTEASASGESLRNFSLAPYLFTGDWPTLYEPGGPLDRDLAIPLGGVWQCVVNPGNWRVHYSPLRGDFYVHHTLNVNADGEVEPVYYGPIEGNPIELLRLENYIVESINQTHAAEIFGSPLEINALQSLVDSQEPTLVASGFRVLLELDSLEVNEALHLLPSFDAAAEWLSTMPENEDLVNETQAAMDRHSSRIEELKIEVPADEYMSRGTEPTAEELAANWGPEVDGLSMAIIPWEEGEPSLRLGERVEAWLAVRNMSDEPIRFSSYTMMDGVSTVLVDEDTKDEQQIWFPAFDHWPVAMRFRLDPGQVIRLKHAAFWSGVQQLQDGSAQINVQPGHTYRLSMSLQLPESFQKNGEGRILVPARGEYFNQLESGVVRIRVAEIDGAVPPESDQSDMQDEDADRQPESGGDNVSQRSLHGFVLTPYAFNGDWDALFEIDGPLYRGLPASLGGVWRCRVNSADWALYYSPLKQLFYVHLRLDQVDEYFGPIEGNAIELLKIEQHLADAFNAHHEAGYGDTPYSMQFVESLLESGEPTLMASGFRTLTHFEALTVFEEYRLRPLVERVFEAMKAGVWISPPTDPPELVDQVQPLEFIQVPELSDLADAALAYMNEQHERIESLKVTFDDSEYTPGREPTDEELAAEWGPDVDGLALVAMNWYVHPADSSTPVISKPLDTLPRHYWAAGEVPTLAVGGFITSQLLIRNVSDEPRKIATLNTMDGVGAEMIDEETRHSAILSYGSLSGIPLTERYLLQPGEVVEIKRVHFQIVEGDLHPYDRPFNPTNRDIIYGQIRVREGRSYRVEYYLNLPSAYSNDADGRITLPASGEFHGHLDAVPMRFEVAGAVAASDKSMSDNLSFLHSDDDGTMRFTPTNAEERELVNQILVWGSNDQEGRRVGAPDRYGRNTVVESRGNVFEGWRVGALLVNDLDSDEPLTAGETVSVKFFLQNVSDEPQTIRVLPMTDSFPTLETGGQITLSPRFGNEFVEVTAQPGEAVSPDGCGVRLDTTGFSNGEYLLNFTSAFLIPAENGDGGRSPWNVGSLSMTIGDGGPANEGDAPSDDALGEHADDAAAAGELTFLHNDDDGTTRLTPTNDEESELVDQILSWGSNERHGWRVGALLVNDLDTDEPLKAGDTAGVQYFLQNVSDAPQTVRVQLLREPYPVLGTGGKLNLNTMTGNGSVEITAQPGEAVSPDGFNVLLDTTGFPDGEYSLYSTAVFSIPNEDGNGGGSPWRVGSVTLKIGEGTPFDTEPTTDEAGIVWGATVAGMRVGMRLPEGQRDWPVGSLLEGELFVRNVGDTPIAFEWDQPAPLDQNQVVYDANGKYVRLNSVFFTGARARNPQSYSVAPGEQLSLGTAQLKVQAEVSDIEPTDPAQLITTSGVYTWQVHLELPRAAIPGTTIIIGSGPVPFEVVGDEEPSEEDSEASNDQSDPETPSELDANEGETHGTEVSEAAIIYPELPSLPAFPHEEEIRLERERLTRLIEQTGLIIRAHEFEDRISWGTPHEGWRAGMVIVGENEVGAGDRVIVQFYVQNVTAEEQSLRLREFSPSTLQFLAGHNIIRLTASGDSNEITELVADAGKIVLLEGYLAELDTTGLPDGDYLIEANAGNHAYWIANEHDQASYEHRMGRCTLRIGEGGEPADSSNTQLIPTDDQIWWGPDVAGMRLGMQMLDKQTDWPMGSRIESVIYVMNATDQDITFETWWDLPSNLDMSVYAADEYVATRPGEDMTPLGLDVREIVVYDYFMKSFTVPSGEMLELGRYFLDSGAESEDSRAGLAPRLTAESGMFKWVGRLGFQREDLPNFSCNMETGPAYFSVRAQVATNHASHAPIFAANDVSPEDEGHVPEVPYTMSPAEALSTIIDERVWIEMNDDGPEDDSAAPEKLTRAVQTIAAMLRTDSYHENEHVRAASQILSEQHRPFIVTGRIVDTAGNSVEGARVEAICNWEPIHPTGVTFTDKDGNYVLRFSELYRPTLNICWIRVTHAGMFETTFSREANVVLVNERDEGERLVDEGFADANAMLLRGNPRRFDFTMAPGATIHGTLTDAAGNRVGDTHVWMWSDQVMPGWAEEPSNFHWYLDATTNSEGEFTFTGVPTGWEFAFRGDSADARRNQFVVGEGTTPEPPGDAYSIDLECIQSGSYHATLCTDGTGTMRSVQE